MYIDKIFLTIVLCATNAWCIDRMLTRSGRTINLSSSFLAWPQTLKNLWPDRPQLWEWTRSGAVNLIRFASVSSMPMRIEFGPEDGLRAAETYRRRFGYRAEWLIEQLGNGVGPNAPLYRQPVPNIFLSPPPFTSGGNFF